MTTTKASGKQATDIWHSQKYQGEALKLAADLGIAKAAKQLGLHESPLYAWRKDREHARTVSDRETALAAENVRLKRQLAQQVNELSILKNAATYLSTSSGQGSLNHSSEVRLHEKSSS